MRDILYVSMCIPHENIGHAGGKTFNYYINSFANNDENRITMIAKSLPEEKHLLKDINKKIKIEIVSTPEAFLLKMFAYVKSINSKINPIYKYGNTLTKYIYDQIENKIKKLKKEGYNPDVIILEWTSMLLFIETIKKYFPEAIYVSSEHDVSFLGYYRKYLATSGKIKKNISKLKYLSQKKYELDAIDKCDFVVTHNEKDRKLLIDNGVLEKKLGVIAPYYEKFALERRRQSNQRDILFYGAMNRQENILSVKWFIKYVMPLLVDCKIRFVVVGNKPPEELLELNDNRILVTGFVENPAIYFEHAMCMVAPLVLGAGIKVKVLEALSSGIPVLTNNIGIEGIDATPGVNYLHCEKARDYELTIRKILNEEIDVANISYNAQILMKNNYDLEKSFENYSRNIYRLIEGR